MEHYLNYAPCVFFSCKDDGTIVDVNATLCSLLGYSREELIGNKVDVLFTIATRIFQQTHFFPLLKMHGHAEEIYITLQAKDKEHLPVIINAERKSIGEEIVSIYIGIRVHNRKKYEEELIAAKKAAEAALNENTELIKAKQDLQQHLEQLDQQIYLVNKQNEELKQFNRVVSHDLQEPLRKLSVFSNMLLEESTRHQYKTIVEKLKSVSEQMRSTISGLQQYVWLTEASKELKEVDLNKMVLEVEEQLKEENPLVNLQIEMEQLPQLKADKEQMQLLFYHLLSNVIRFRKEGDHAFAKLSASNLKQNRFRKIKDKYKYTEFVKLRLVDSGIGFDSEYNEQAFELFKRLHPVSGRGIGLSLCKKIIENHNGSISIDSKENEGTVITILLPKDEQTISVSNTNQE